MLARSKQLEKEICRIQDMMKAYPEGNLLCARNGKNIKWYKSNGRKPIYIPKEKRLYAEQLAVRKYLMAECEELQQEKNAVDAYIKAYRPPKINTQELLAPDSPYAQLLSSHFKSRSEKWKPG